MGTEERGHRRERWAHLRFSIVGPLLAAPPTGGELHEALIELSAKTWHHPTTGAPIRFGVSTIERWYYAALNANQDPVGALRRDVRKDAGKARAVSEALRAIVRSQYQAHTSWSYQLHYDNLKVLVAEDPALAPLPTYANGAPLHESPGAF